MSDLRLLEIDYATPPTTGKVIGYSDGRWIPVNPTASAPVGGTVNRVNGQISSIVSGGVTKTYTRNTQGFVTGMSDGSNIYTYVRDASNNITSWSVV